MAFSLTRGRVVLLVALGAAFIAGALAPFAVATEGPALRVWSGSASLVATALVASWCQEDSRPRNIRVGKPMLWLIVLIAPLGLLVYLFRSRRPSRAVLAVLLCGFFASVVLVAMVAGAVAGVLIGEAIAPAPSQ